jgi:hypothetical protein
MKLKNNIEYAIDDDTIVIVADKSITVKEINEFKQKICMYFSDKTYRFRICFS